MPIIQRRSEAIDNQNDLYRKSVLKIDLEKENVESIIETKTYLLNHKIHCVKYHYALEQYV